MAVAALSRDTTYHDQLDEKSLAEETRARLREARVATPAGARQLRAAVISDHLWLARSVANRYRNRGEDYDDLLQVACIGLVEAVKRFDPDRGDLISFAMPTITGVVKRHFRDRGWVVRPSRRTQELVTEIRREWPDLAQELGHVPTTSQLAERLGESKDDIAEARRASEDYHPLSIDVLIDGYDRLGISNAAESERVEARIIVEQALRKLDDDDRRLIWMRFFEERSQADIAQQIGTSQMQVSRKLSRLLARLHGLIGNQEPMTAAA